MHLKSKLGTCVEAVSQYPCTCDFRCIMCICMILYVNHLWLVESQTKRCVINQIISNNHGWIRLHHCPINWEGCPPQTQKKNVETQPWP